MSSSKQITKIAIAMSISWVLGGLCLGQDFWKRAYGGGGEAYQIVYAADGNYLQVGTIRNSGGYDGLIVKFNRNGDTLWSRTYDSAEFEFFKGVIPTSDGKFLVVGIMATSNCGWLLKIDTDGDTLWTKKYSSEVLSSILPASGGNFLIAGTYYKPDNYQYGIVMKVSANGDSLWSKLYGGNSGNTSFNAIVPAADGNYLAGGSCNASGYLVKLTPAGDTLWTATCGLFGKCAVIDIAPVANGDCMVAGNDGKSLTGWVSKISSSGKEQWTKNSWELGLNGQVTSIVPAEDGSFLASSFYSSLSPNWYGKIAKINPDGAIVWDKKYSDAYFPSAILGITGGDFVVGGYDAISQAKYSMYYLIGDRYARRGTLFIYKIPCLGADSLNYGFSPLNVPSGMTCSAGGTITWAPTTDSVYMDHVEYLVLDDHGRRDTLSFNLYVNCEYGQAILGVGSGNKRSFFSGLSPAITAISAADGSVVFIVPSSASELQICDISGRLLCRLAPVVSGSGARAVWQGSGSGGRRIGGKYFARAVGVKGCAVVPFLLKR